MKKVVLLCEYVQQTESVKKWYIRRSMHATYRTRLREGEIKKKGAHSYQSYPCLDFQPDEDERRVEFEDRSGDHGASDIHQ
jgi:hypothetical protein